MDEKNVNVNETVSAEDIKKVKMFRTVAMIVSILFVIFIAIWIILRIYDILNPKPMQAPDVYKAEMKQIEIKTSRSNKEDINVLQDANYIETPDIDDINVDYSYDIPGSTAKVDDSYEAMAVADIDVPDAKQIVDIYANKGSGEVNTQNETVLCSEKPVIYVYNMDDTPLNIKLEFPGQLNSTYPAINSNNSWDLTVYSNSMFKDSKGIYYPYLFYEGMMEQAMFDGVHEGACVKGSETVEFLYKTLQQFGMNDIECSDFITYWAPRMEKNPYNLISFQNSRYSALVPIKTEPVIDTQIRIYMVWQASDEEVELSPQTLDVINRPEDGSVPYLLEWGGAELGSTGVYGVSSKQISEMSADEIQNEIVTLSDMTTKANLRLSNLMAAASGIDAVNNNTSSGGHTFKDRNGRTVVFTTAEWQKLHDTWDYTGKFDEMINQFTVDELKNYLRLN